MKVDDSILVKNDDSCVHFQAVSALAQFGADLDSDENAAPPQQHLFKD